MVFMISFSINILLFSLLLLEDISMFLLFVSIGAFVSILITLSHYFIYKIVLKENEVLITMNFKKQVLKFQNLIQLEYKQYHVLNKRLHDFSISDKLGTISIPDGLFEVDELIILFKQLQKNHNIPFTNHEVINMNKQ